MALALRLETVAYIALGSNIEPRVRHLARSVYLISKQQDVTVETVSNVYTAKAHTLGGARQADYLNAAARVRTGLDPRRLLERCLEVEKAMGRIRSSGRWRPREIDIDVLLFGETVIDSEHLTLPHPGLSKRLFVLRPLSDIWPGNASVPGFERTLNDLIATCPDKLEPVKTVLDLNNYV